MVSVEKRRSGKTVIFACGDKILLEDIAALREAFYEAMAEGLDTLVLDLSKINHIDSSGISLFVSTKNALSKLNAHLVLAGMIPSVLDIFLKTSLDAYFDIRPTWTEETSRS